MRQSHNGLLHMGTDLRDPNTRKENVIPMSIFNMNILTDITVAFTV